MHDVVQLVSASTTFEGLLGHSTECIAAKIGNHSRSTQVRQNDLDTLIAVVRTATNSSSLTAAVRSRLEAIAAVPGRVYGVTRNQKSLHIPLSMRTLSAQARRHHHTEPLIVLVLWLLAA